VRRKGKMERWESMCTRGYSIVSNVGKGTREVRGKVERDIWRERAWTAPLRKKMV
jgi:hypothetical protein